MEHGLFCWVFQSSAHHLFPSHFSQAILLTWRNVYAMLRTMCVCHVYGRLKRPTPILAANIQLIEHYRCTIHRAMERQWETNKKETTNKRPDCIIFIILLHVFVWSHKRDAGFFLNFFFLFFASFSFCSSFFLFGQANGYTSLVRKANSVAGEISNIHNKCMQFHSILVLCNEAKSPRTICTRN